MRDHEISWKVSVDWAEPDMRTFSYFIQDDRYSVPTLQFAVVPDETRAREFARRQLMTSPHYRSIEVHENGRPLFRQDRTGPV
jgi:hypothetical protein